MTQVSSLQPYQSWLTSTYINRYTVVSFQTLTFTTGLFASLFPLKYLVRYFQPKIPTSLYAILPAPLPLASTTVKELVFDVLAITLIIALIQLALHLSHYASIVTNNITNQPQSYPSYSILQKFSLIKFITTTRGNKANTINTFRLFYVLLSTLLLVFLLSCSLIGIPTTTSPATNLFSFHDKAELTTSSILSPFNWLKSSQPIFWNQGGAYTIDCLATTTGSSSKTTTSPSSSSNPLSQFSSNLYDHSYSVYNPSYYPSLAQLYQLNLPQSNVADLINYYTSDDLYTQYRQHVGELQYATFSERYDVNIDPNLSSTSLNTSQPQSQQHPLVPTLSSSLATIPPTTPTHATSRPLSANIINTSIPILSLHQFHKAQQTKLTTEQVENLSTVEYTLHSDPITNQHICFIFLFITFTLFFAYTMFNMLGVPQTSLVFFRFVAILIGGCSLTMIIAMILTIPVLQFTNFLLTLFIANSTFNFKVLFHILNMPSPTIIATTLPTATLAQLTSTYLSGFGNEQTIMNNMLCPDTFRLALIPYSINDTLPIKVLFGMLFVVLLILSPFCYHIYRIKSLLQTPLNYSKYILQALTDSQQDSMQNRTDATFLSPYTIPHTLTFLSTLARDDKLYLALNNSAYQPLLSSSATPLSSSTPSSPTSISHQQSALHEESPYYVRLYMDYLIHHCINLTTQQIYSLLLQYKTLSRKNSSYNLPIRDISMAIQPLAKQITTQQPTISAYKSKSLFALIPSCFSQFKAFIVSEVVADPTIIFSLLTDTLVLPTNLAVITGNVIPLVDQSCQFVYSSNHKHISIQYISQSLSSLLQLQQALEDLILLISQNELPQQQHGLNFTPQHLQQLKIEPTSTCTQAFGYLVFRSHLAPQLQRSLQSIYDATVNTTQKIINHHFGRNKLNLNIILPNSLTTLFNKYLEQRPSA